MFATVPAYIIRVAEEPREQALIPDGGTALPVPASQARRWKAPECPFTVEYTAELMLRLRDRAVKNFRALPNGGLEEGGVLFGRVLPNARMMQRVEVVAERPIECAHALGPAFVLSDEEKTQVAALTDSGRWDREISGLSVVGFWIAHGRSELALTPDDLDLYRQLFPNPWQIALVLKPHDDGVPRASFFFRAGGVVAPHRKSHEFFTDPNFTGTEEEKYRPISKRRRGDLANAVPENAALLPAAAETGSQRRTLAGAVIASLLVGALMGYAVRGLMTPVAAVKPHDPELALELFSAGRQLLVHWNARSWEVDHARSGQLIVESAGIAKPVPLTSRELFTGYTRLPLPSADTTVTLRLLEDDGHTEQQQRYWVPGQ